MSGATFLLFCLRQTLDPQSSCLSLPSAGIIDVYHHAWLDMILNLLWTTSYLNSDCHLIVYHYA
jgi:hypothetical protein